MRGGDKEEGGRGVGDWEVRGGLGVGAGRGWVFEGEGDGWVCNALGGMRRYSGRAQ